MTHLIIATNHHCRCHASVWRVWVEERVHRGVIAIYKQEKTLVTLATAARVDAAARCRHHRCVPLWIVVQIVGELCSDSAASREGFGVRPRRGNTSIPRGLAAASAWILTRDQSHKPAPGRLRSVADSIGSGEQYRLERVRVLARHDATVAVHTDRAVHTDSSAHRQQCTPTNGAMLNSPGRPGISQTTAAGLQSRPTDKDLSQARYRDHDLGVGSVPRPHRRCRNPRRARAEHEPRRGPGGTCSWSEARSPCGRNAMPHGAAPPTAAHAKRRRPAIHHLTTHARACAPRRRPDLRVRRLRVSGATPESPSRSCSAARRRAISRRSSCET